MKWKVDLVASQPHYERHMLPIWRALPEEYRGDCHPLRDPVVKPYRGRVAMVAGWSDLAPLRGQCPMIYVEHGAGQGYAGDEKTAHWSGYSTSGGRQHVGVMAYISPSEIVARRWTKAPAVAVGCPKLDQYREMTPLIPKSICIAFHWDCLVAPEARSAFDHYSADLPAIVQAFKAQGWSVYGHAHPKWEGAIDAYMRDCGIEVIDHEESVFQLCTVLVMDNSSLMYEWASLDRPVVALNAPWYRKDVEHGLRFWSHVPGMEIDGPEQLLHVNLERLATADPGLRRRRRAANHAYAFMDGSSSQRAADFIVRQLDKMEA